MAVTSEQILRAAFVKLDVSTDFTDAVLRLNDQSQLLFRHRVGERWSKSLGPSPQQTEGVAFDLLWQIVMFRLNAKHLEIQFEDQSRWEFRFKNA
jgi:hypothetical protein